ncbi:hypothetical protein LQW54_000775 [Pestalotiopsis sp. IQ-011]
MATNSSNTAVPSGSVANGNANIPLNPQRRPQRPFGKLRAAMNAVDKKLEQCTAIPEALSDSNLAQFRSKVREILRQDNESFDNWTPHVRHDDGADARRVILQVMENNTDLFEGIDGMDESVPSELIFQNFYTT